MKNNNTILYIGAAAAAYYLFLRPQTPTTPGSSSVSVINPSTGLTSLLPGSSSGTPTTYGVNVGVPGGSPQITNYAALLAANPNLANPNYQMTAAENAQYLANYLDLQQGLQSWINHKMADGTTPKNIQQAAQSHWHMYGCAEKRIFLPLQPPSSKQFVPPPANAKSSGGGSSWVGTALTVAGSVAVALIGPPDSEPTEQLSDAEIQMLVTGGAILKKILPFYLEVAPTLVTSIENKLDSLVSQYAD